MEKAERLYEHIKNPDVDDDILELYILYIKTNKRDRPIANNRYKEDPPEDIKNALIENGKRTKEGKWTKKAIDELNKWQEVYPDVDVFDVEQLGGRRRKKKSRRRRTKKKKRRRTKKKRRRTKKKRRKRRRTRRKRGGDKYIKGNGNKCKDSVGAPGRLRGPNSICLDPPGNGHNNCYWRWDGNDCKGILNRHQEDKHCVNGQCV